MINESIKKMLQEPGIYEVSTTLFSMHGRYFLAEVTADGRCYVLNKEMKRNGELKDKGWNDDAKCLGRYIQ
jgi:hypothetical protein